MVLQVGTSSEKSPVSSTVNGPFTDRMRRSFTNTAGYSSGYSIFAAHINPDQPIGLLVHLHGDGAYEYENDPDTWYLTGPTGILTLAQERNMILVVPRTPDRVGSATWWESMAAHGGWAADLIRSILGMYMIDLRRLWISGFSGGAELLSYGFIPDHLHNLGVHAGGIVIIGGGGALSTLPASARNSPMKATFPLTWVVGQYDLAENAGDGFDGLEAATEGEALYRSHGWDTKLVVVPGQEHLLVNGQQGLYGQFIGEAIDEAPQPVVGGVRGTVVSAYAGTEPLSAIYYGSTRIWGSSTHI